MIRGRRAFGKQHLQTLFAEGAKLLRRTQNLRESEGLKLAELAKAESLAEVNREFRTRSWHEHFDHPE